LSALCADNLLAHKYFYSSTLRVVQHPMITLQVNGEERQCNPDRTMLELLEFLNMNPRLVAVEYNGEILHRQFWQETIIKEGDRLEIVTIVGGG